MPVIIMPGLRILCMDDNGLSPKALPKDENYLQLQYPREWALKLLQYLTMSLNILPLFFTRRETACVCSCPNDSFVHTWSFIIQPPVYSFYIAKTIYKHSLFFVLFCFDY